MPIDSDVDIVGLNPDVQLDCIYQSLKFLDLLKFTRIHKKMQNSYGENIGNENPGFLMKFMVVNEILTELFQIKITLIDVMKPRLKFFKNIMGKIMDFDERLQVLKMRFEEKNLKIQELQSQMIHNKKQIENLENNFEDIKIIKQEEYKEVECIEQKINGYINQKSNIVNDQQRVMDEKKSLENNLFELKEVLINFEEEYKETKNKGKYLKTQVVNNYSDILSKKTKCEDEIQIWNGKDTELKRKLDECELLNKLIKHILEKSQSLQKNYNLT